ncbi:baseplate assembly protein [Klebsiella pneumoniae]|nr:baseplate assembly protein [Klebsiella pneumoniae]
MWARRTLTTIARFTAKGCPLMDEIADLRQRIANMVRRGVISEVRMASPVMVRVRCGELPSPWLPWCQTQSGKHLQVSNPPAVGDAVTILSEAGDIRNGRVYPGANIAAVPVPSTSEDEHVMAFDNGTKISYDRSKNHLSIQLAEGGTWSIKGDGEIDGELLVKKSIQSEADISDKDGKMSKIRTTYNQHDHPGDSGGRTGDASPQM